jgi:ribosome-binding ATPase YchF (GTP1/OBG family)
MGMKKKAEAEKLRLSVLLAEKLSGLNFSKGTIIESIRELGIVDDSPRTWGENLQRLITIMRQKAKPIVIVANKIDQVTALDNYQKMKEELGDKVFPASALSEVFLRTEDECKSISYSPGDSSYQVLDDGKLGKKKSLLEKIKKEILDKYGSTGVQEIVRYVVFDIMEMIVVYPVEDITKFTDNDGNVLPDAFLVPKGTTAIEFAGKIHTDFAKNFIHAQLAPSGRRIGADYELQENDIIKIISAAK